MSKFRNFLWIFVLVMMVISIVACEKQVQVKEKQEEPPVVKEKPVVVEEKPKVVEEKPLLLEDPPLLLEDEEETGPVADNSRCHVCHINYDEEVLAVTHARANISCEQCHGASDDHCGDEDNITPPDIMYPAEKIRPFCMGCHTSEKIDIAVHKSVMAKPDAKESICTNCHGEHRLGYRTRKWDKTTGELVQDDKVRMTEKQEE
ncbi:MAG: hypothetical protein GWN13_06585 [Phycisphaerae bacterium]|nr:hypothetical protein [Phycisphaerae bacterium]